MLDQYVWDHEYDCIACYHDNDDLVGHMLQFSVEEWPLKLTDYVMRSPDPLVFQS
jgi:hypothetical protein